MSKITLKLMQHLQQTSHQPVLKDETTQRWFAGNELAADVDQLKDQLKGLHVGHGDVVLVALPNSAVYPVLIQAIWELGAVVMPVADDVTPTGLNALLHQRAFAACVVTPELLNAATDALSTVTRLQLNTTDELTLVRNLAVKGNVAATPTEADLALLVTVPNASKRLGLTYAQLRDDAGSAVAEYHLTAADRTLLVTSLAQRDAQVALLAARLTGSRVILSPSLDASQFWPQVLDNAVTHLALPSGEVTSLLKTLSLMSPAGHLEFMPHATTSQRYHVRQPAMAASVFINGPKKSIIKDRHQSVGYVHGSLKLAGAFHDTG